MFSSSLSVSDTMICIRRIGNKVDQIRHRTHPLLHGVSSIGYFMADSTEEDSMLGAVSIGNVGDIAGSHCHLYKSFRTDIRNPVPGKAHNYRVFHGTCIVVYCQEQEKRPGI